ncbi:MAG: hypothetical protein Q9204_005332 [Flavoplaca sp. TL-2023a]
MCHILSRQSTGDFHRHLTQLGVDSHIECKTTMSHPYISSISKRNRDRHSPFRPLNDGTTHADQLSHHTLPIPSSIKLNIINLILQIEARDNRDQAEARTIAHRSNGHERNAAMRAFECVQFHAPTGQEKARKLRVEAELETEFVILFAPAKALGRERQDRDEPLFTGLWQKTMPCPSARLVGRTFDL